MRPQLYCAHCEAPIQRSDTGTLQDGSGLSYCPKAPNSEPSHALQDKPQALRTRARKLREEAEELKRGSEPGRYSVAERDARELEDVADLLEAQAEHEETRADSEASLSDVLGTILGDVWEVYSEDAAGYTDLSYSSLRERVPFNSECKLEERTREGSLFVFVSDFVTGSDYGGSGSLSKANLRDLIAACEEAELEQGSDYWTLSGGYGSFGLALRWDLRSSAVVELLQGLEDYPCASEETLAEVESEEEEQAWSNFYASDFERKLEAEHSLDLSEVEPEALRQLFEEARERANEYWTHESDGASIDLERVCREVSREQALALPGAARDSAELEAEAQALAQVERAEEPWKRAQEERSKPQAERTGAVVEHVEALRLALGAPSEEACGSVAGFLAQLSRWPVGEHGPDGSETPEQLRAVLGILRSHVGNVVQAAREELERFAPERFKRETERGEFGPLPVETRPRS